MSKQHYSTPLQKKTNFSQLLPLLLQHCQTFLNACATTLRATQKHKTVKTQKQNTETNAVGCQHALKHQRLCLCVSGRMCVVYGSVVECVSLAR